MHAAVGTSNTRYYHSILSCQPSGVEGKWSHSLSFIESLQFPLLIDLCDCRLLARCYLGRKSREYCVVNNQLICVLLIKGR